MYTLSTRKRHAAPTRALLAGTFALVCAFATACGGSDSGGGDAAGDPEVLAQAEERLQPYLDEPTTIPVTTPLTSKPEEGKTLYLIHYNIPIGARLVAPTEAAAEALGWNFEALAVDPADPLSQANAVKQAIAGGADFIEVSSGSVESIGDGIAAAREAGVPIFLQAGDTVPEGEKNWIFGNVNFDYVNEVTMALLDYAIVDGNGTADVLLLTTSDYPIVAAMNEYVKEEFPKNCETCELQIENASAADLAAGKAPDLAVAAIRKNPDLKYIVIPVESSANGMPQALAAAGIEAKILILGASETQPAGLQDGSYAALAMQSNDAQPWMAVDLIARYSVGDDIALEEHRVDPGWIWTKENAPEGETEFLGPEGYQEQYKELWQITP